MITAKQFEEEYAKRSGITVEELREHSVVVNCNCDYEKCEGWASITREFFEWETAHGNIYNYVIQQIL